MKFAFYREQKHPHSHLDRFPFSNDGELFLYSYTIDRDLLNRLRSLLSSNISLFSHPGRSLQESFSLLLDKVNASLRLPDFREHLHGKEHFMVMVTRSRELHFSLLGQLTVGYVEGGVFTQLSEGMTTAGYDFGYISSGSVQERSLLLVSHRSISTRFVKDDLVALLESEGEDDLYQNLEYIWREHQIGEGGVAVFIMDPLLTHRPGSLDYHTHGDISAGGKLWKYCQSISGACLKMIQTNVERFYRYFSFDRKRKIAIFSLGVLLSCVLLFVLLSSILRIASTPLTQDHAAKLLFDIRSHIEEASKNSVNKELFSQEIQEARNLLTELEKTGYYIQDRLNLTHDLEVLQKQVNGIISIVPRENQKLYTYTSSEIDSSSQWVFDLKQGFVSVGSSMIIDTVGKTDKEPQKTPLPSGEKVLDVAIGDANVIYILTESRKVFRYSQGVLKQVSIESTIPGVAPEWADAQKIVFYNSNIYLLGKDGVAVFRHKPILTGYSARYENILSGLPAPQPIIDFSIERDVYVLRANGTLERIVTGATPSRNVLMMKNLPSDTLPIIFDTKKSSLVHTSTTKNIFILSSGSAMVFRPNTLTTSRQSELNYLGTIDITNESIQSLYPISDTVFLVATHQGIYKMEFQIDEDKILPR